MLGALPNEKLNKQLVGKLPYAFLISLAIAAILGSALESYRDSIIIFALVAVASFFAFNTLFSASIQRTINDKFFDGDLLHQTKPLYSAVVDEGDSLLANIGKLKKHTLILGAIGGGWATAFFVAVILLIIGKLAEEIEALLATAAIASFLVYYDLMKSPLETDDASTEAKKEKNPFAYGLAERFLLTNSLKKMPKFRAPFWRLLIRVCGPVLHIQMPRFGYEELIVYDEKGLQQKLCDLSDEKRASGIILQHVQGLKITELILESNMNRSERIHLLAQRTPIENFPYLYGLEQSTQCKVWGLFRIVDAKAPTKSLGQFYVHVFRGLLIRQRLRQIEEPDRQKTPSRKLKVDQASDGHVKREYAEEAVFLFILIGEQTTAKYVATELGLTANKFPRDLISIEWNEK